MMDSDTHVLNPAWPTGITLCGRQVRADELVTVTPTCKGCRRILKSPPSRRAWAVAALRTGGKGVATSRRKQGPLWAAQNLVIGREARLLESG